MIKLGGGLLEALLGLDLGHRGTRVDCGAGHLAEFSDYRAKTSDTSLGPVRLRRAYYYCTGCGHGRFPRDEELGVAGHALRPGLRRMVDRVGSQELFGQGSRDLAELDGLNLTSTRVQRSAEADGEVIRAAIAVQAGAVLSGKMVRLVSSTLVASQFPVEMWHDALADRNLADAILDRPVHIAYRITLKGPSTRRREPEVIPVE